MNQAEKLKLHIGTVDAATLDSTFSWSLHREFLADPDTELVESIDRFGLLRPLIVRKNHKVHELICGARRLEALHQCGKVRQIPCYFAEHPAGDIELLRLVAEDQKQNRPLSPIETAYLIDMFHRRDLQENTNDLERTTGTRSKTERHRLTSLLELEQPMIRAIHHGFLSVANGLTMTGLDKKERTFVFDLFNRLSLNAGKQRRLLELAAIISAAQQLSLDEVLAENFPEVCGGFIDNIPQTSARMFKKLYEMSHPHVSAARKEFHERVRRLRLPDNCRLDPCPSFERDSVSFTAEFENFDSFQQAWQRLEEIV